jgi:hypothetical protein
MAKELEKLRVEIDALDKKIQSLIGSRAELASAVAEVSHSPQPVWLRFDLPYSEYFDVQLPNESPLFSAFLPLEKRTAYCLVTKRCNGFEFCTRRYY